MKRCVLALDLAKVTGYACWREGDPKPNAGIIDVSHLKKRGDRLASQFKWGVNKVKEWEVTDIVVEAPIIGGGNEDKIIWLVGCLAIFEMLGSQYKIDVTKVRNDTFFIHWCGTNNIEGDQRKVYSVLECQRRGFPLITDHNTADAMGVLSFRCAQLNMTPPWDFRRSPGPLFTGSAMNHKQLKGTRITPDNKRAAAIIVNRQLHGDGAK